MIRRCEDASLVKFIFIYFDVISISKKNHCLKKRSFIKISKATKIFLFV